MKRYIVFSYDNSAEGPFGTRRSEQQKVGEFADRAEADRAAYDAVAVHGREGGQVLCGTREVYWIDQDELGAGALPPTVAADGGP